MELAKEIVSELMSAQSQQATLIPAITSFMLASVKGLRQDEAIPYAVIDTLKLAAQRHQSNVFEAFLAQKLCKLVALLLQSFNARLLANQLDGNAQEHLRDLL